MTDISLRDATDQDFDFLYELHRRTLKDYIDQTWGWDEDWQESHFGNNFELKGRSIIRHGGNDIGCLTVLDEGDHLFLSYIALEPDFQGKGVGTRLIKDVLEQGRRVKKPVTLKVLKTNPARRLYVRLGFRITQESDTHYFMTAEPSRGSA